MVFSLLLAVALPLLIAFGFSRWIHYRTGEAQVVDVLCRCLRDPHESWHQARFTYKNTERDIKIWTSTGFLDLDGLGFYAKFRIARAIRVAQKHELMRKTGVIPEEAPIDATPAQVIEMPLARRR